MAPSFFVTVTFSRGVVRVTESSLECIVHCAAGQLSLMTTNSARFGNEAVGEYRTRMIESEHTCTFNEPVAIENKTPSACCCTFRTGFMGIHCAWVVVAHNRLKESTIRNTRGDCLSFVIAN